MMNRLLVGSKFGAMMDRAGLLGRGRLELWFGGTRLFLAAPQAGLLVVVTQREKSLLRQGERAGESVRRIQQVEDLLDLDRVERAVELGQVVLRLADQRGEDGGRCRRGGAVEPVGNC